MKSASLLTLVLSTTETRPGCKIELAFSPYLTMKIERTVVVCLLEVHVDNTTRPDLGHGVAVQGGNLSERTRLNVVATILSEENRSSVVAELLSSGTVAGLLIGGVTAPGVNVVAPEVDGLIIILAVQVVGKVNANGGNISSGISDTHATVSLLLDIGLHITDRRLDVGASLGGGGSVRDLVTSEETDGVVVLLKLVDDTGVSGVEANLPLRVGTVNGTVGGRQVGDEIDARILEKLHARGVVGIGVDVVGPNDIGA